MDFRNSQAQREDEILGRNKQLQESSSLARRLDDQRGSKITQYFNVSNRSFENSEHTQRNPKQQSDRSENAKLQMFSSFPEEQNEHKNPPFHQNPSFYPNNNYYVNLNHLDTSNKNFLLNPKPENVKESRIEQSLQKAFNLNRSTNRIPFKKRQISNEQKMTLGETFQVYNFYHPSYDEYFPKQHRKFWIEAFQKFYDKRVTLQALEFPSFQSKDQSKSYEHLSEIHKKDHKPSRQNKSSGREKINKFMKRCSGINTVLLVAILIIGLIILLKK